MHTVTFVADAPAYTGIVIIVVVNNAPAITEIAITVKVTILFINE
ncbi:MAG: hypothetical protein ACPKPY_03515 [Nitrososphaeraceae archaeon]